MLSFFLAFFLHHQTKGKFIAEEGEISFPERLIGDDDNDSISSKEEGYQRDDSRDLEDFAEEEGVSNEHKARPAIARKRVKQRVNPSEEETQIIPLSLGHYIDHSQDSIIDDPPFAPLHRKANFPETLFCPLLYIYPFRSSILS